MAVLDVPAISFLYEPLGENLPALSPVRQSSDGRVFDRVDLPIYFDVNDDDATLQALLDDFIERNIGVVECEPHTSRLGSVDDAQTNSVAAGLRAQWLGEMRRKRGEACCSGRTGFRPLRPALCVMSRTRSRPSISAASVRGVGHDFLSRLERLTSTWPTKCTTTLAGRGSAWSPRLRSLTGCLPGLGLFTSMPWCARRMQKDQRARYGTRASRVRDLGLPRWVIGAGSALESAAAAVREVGPAGAEAALRETRAPCVSWASLIRKHRALFPCGSFAACGWDDGSAAETADPGTGVRRSPNHNACRAPDRRPQGRR